MLLGEIVARLGGALHGAAQIEISRVAPLASAKAGDLAFLSNPKYRGQLAQTHASAVILRELPEQVSFAAIVTENPYAYYARVVGLLYPSASPAVGIHASAVVADGVEIAEGCSIGPLVSIATGVKLGVGVSIGAGCHIGQDVEIGSGSVLHPRVTIYEGCRLGQRVLIHAGAVIGSDGFGMAWDSDHWEKIPQVGCVVIGDDVEIGANTTIDRGALENTVIGNGVKLDNQIQIGHNVRIGEHTAMAGCVGIAGSTRIGARCQLGGGAIVLGHLNVVDDVVINAGTLITKSIARAGTYTSAHPFAAHRDWLRNAAHIRHLDELVARVAQLEQQVTDLAQMPDREDG